MFTSLLQTDVKLQSGCEIVWRKESGGFEGTTNPVRCHVASALNGEALRVELKLKLRSDSLQITERRYDAAGTLVQGGPQDAGYLFQRRTD